MKRPRFIWMFAKSIVLMVEGFNSNIFFRWQHIAVIGGAGFELLILGYFRPEAGLQINSPKRSLRPPTRSTMILPISIR